jgi:hypothetical protein
VSSERGSAGVRGTIIFLVVAAVLAAALYGTDSYVHRRVEHELASRLQSELGTPAPPQIDIAGRPFLTQVAARDVRSVHLIGDQLGSSTDGTLPIEHVDLTLTDVTTSDWWKTMVVGHASGTALVGYDALRASAGVPLSYAGNGRFTVDSDTSVYGIPVHAKVTGGLALDVPSQSVTLADPTVEVSGVQLPDVAARALITAVVKPIPLEGVPFDLKVTSVNPQDDGLHAGLSGDNIPVTR